MATQKIGDQDVNEDELYELFPHGADNQFGPAEGFNTWVRINDARLFTQEALRNPAIQEFVEAPISVSYAQFKSSTRESEYFVHKPVRAMTEDAPGIVGKIDRFPTDEPRIPTLVINHEASLAKKITRTIVITDNAVAGQIIHKEASA